MGFQRNQIQLRKKPPTSSVDKTCIKFITCSRGVYSKGLYLCPSFCLSAWHTYIFGRFISMSRVLYLEVSSVQNCRRSWPWEAQTFQKTACFSSIELTTSSVRRQPRFVDMSHNPNISAVSSLFCLRCSLKLNSFLFSSAGIYLHALSAVPVLYFVITCISFPKGLKSNESSYHFSCCIRNF